MKFVLLALVAVIATVTAVPLASVKANAEVALFRQSSLFQATHGNFAELEKHMDFVYSQKDRLEMIGIFLEMSDATMRALGCQEHHIAAFRKASAGWSFPTWESVKQTLINAGAAVRDWAVEKVDKLIAKIKDTWATIKSLASDIWNGNWCGVCGTVTEKLGDGLTEKLSIDFPSIKELICNAISFVVEKTCPPIMTAIIGPTVATVTVGGLAVLSGKIADGVCWVIEKLNSLACDKLYGEGLAKKAEATWPNAAALHSALDAGVTAFNNWIKASIAEYTGKKGKICGPNGIAVCDANGNQA
jgi:hypothetical protein